MANTKITDRNNVPGKQITITTPTDVKTDTVTLHGRTLSVQEWVRRGVLRTVSAAGGNTTYVLTAQEPEMF